MSTISILILLGLLYLVYWILNLNYEYWKKRGVPSPPTSFLFGNVGASMYLKKSLGQIFTDIYDAYPGLSYVGFYKMRKPSILLRDPELIKEVTVKEFNSFHDNDISIDEEVEPIGGKNPFCLKGHKWKVVKSQLTPCFTSKKLKGMFPLVEDALKKVIKHLEENPDATGENGLEAKELSAKYATDVVASCAFGLEGKSFEEDDPEFRRMGKKIFQPSLPTVIKHLLLFVVPGLSRFLKVTFFPEDVIKYFTNIVAAALKYREENNIIRNDFLDLMKELKNKPGEYEFTDTDIVAHALGFFTDGFETSSSAMSFILYELGNNSDVQEKLLLEIKETLKHNGKFDYDIINGMQYLDAVVNEGLRMHPPGWFLIRMCTKTFSLPPPKGAGTGPDVTIEVDTPVIIPVYGLHCDPKHFPDPERFDPDRFSESNKEFITKSTYLPFGEGPRGCHGQRFGLMQIKLAVATITASFEIKVNKKTIVPIEIDPSYVIPHAKGGLWLNFYKREN